MSQSVLARAALPQCASSLQTAPDLAASLKKVRKIGYTAVQISAIGPIPTPT